MLNNTYLIFECNDTLIRSLGSCHLVNYLHLKKLFSLYISAVSHNVRHMMSHHVTHTVRDKQKRFLRGKEITK